MLPYVILPVRTELRQWVESISFMNIDFENESLPSVHIYPQTVTEHLYFTIAGSPLLVQTDEQKGFTSYPRNFIVGPQLVNDIVDLGRNRYVARISFRPGGLFRLLGIPLSEMTDGLDLSLVLAKQSRELSDRLAGITVNEVAFDILESFLMKRVASLRPVTPFELAIAEQLKFNGAVAIAKVADWASLSVRQFERKSLTSLGVSPKLYARITRFSGACRYKLANPQKTWLQVTYEYGYADQMHLIDDFKEFTGFSPTSPEGEASISILKMIEGRK